MTPKMPTYHTGMRSTRCRVGLFTAKDLRDGCRDVFGVMWVHAGKHRSETGSCGTFS